MNSQHDFCWKIGKVMLLAMLTLVLVGLPGQSNHLALAQQSDERTVEATVEPTSEPTTEPTSEPRTESTSEPTIEPTTESTVEPTTESTDASLPSKATNLSRDSDGGIWPR